MLNDRVDNYNPSKHHEHVLPVSAAISTMNNTTIPYKYVKPDSIGLLIMLVTFYGIVAFIAIASNILILVAILRRFVPRNTVNIFLASLALSDFIMVALSLFDCFAFINGGWVFGEWTCKIQSLLIEVCFTASTLTLVGISVERYLLICHPHMKRRSMRVIYIIVTSVWFAGIAICSPLLDGYAVYLDLNHEERTKELVCANQNWDIFWERIFYIVFSFIIYIIPMFIMAFSHWRISVSVQARRPVSAATTFMIQDENERKKKCYTIREESSEISDTTTNDQYKRKSSAHKAIMSSLSLIKRKGSTMEKDMNRRERRLKAIRLLFVVTVVFVALWTPFIILRLLLLFGIDINDYIYKFAEVLILSSTAVNGFIYALMSLPFRKAFISIMCCRRHNDVLSRDSAPSNSFSEDNRFSQRMSRTSVYSEPRHHSIVNTPRTFLIGSEKAVV